MATAAKIDLIKTGCWMLCRGMLMRASTQAFIKLDSQRSVVFAQEMQPPGNTGSQQACSLRGPFPRPYNSQSPVCLQSEGELGGEGSQARGFGGNLGSGLALMLLHL